MCLLKCQQLDWSALRIFMNNNDVLRRLRYAFDFGDQQMMNLFAHAGLTASRAQVSDWLKKDEDEAFQPCDDVTLATFLNGLIIERRGRKDGEQPIAEQRLNNNIIFRKLKIALDLKDDDIVQMMTDIGFRISKPELSAFFRRADHHHYRQCQDQILRNFIKAVQIKYRDSAED